MAPVIKELEASESFDPVVAVTAQHRSMLDQVLELFSITPAFDLNIIEPRQSLADVTVRALGRLCPLLERESPDMVVVQGDTTTTFVGALAAFYQGIPVAHVEAGLRTGRRYSPFPEEINRRLTTQLTELHLAPTPLNKRNLLLENVDPSRVLVTGNTVIDALQWAVGQRVAYDDVSLDGIDDDPRKVMLVTAHRRESWGPKMQAIGHALADLATSEPELLIVFPIHKNPVVRDSIIPAIGDLPNVVLVEPLPYGAFARLMNRSDLILTDSGGVQEEAPSLGKPVLVMRDTTERPEAIAAGTVKLVGADRMNVVTEVRKLLHDPAAYRAMANAVNPYGDGRAATRTVDALAHFFGLGPGVREFDPNLAGEAA